MTEGEMEMALQVSGVFKSYGRGSKKVDVLRDFCMNIPRGHIYGLLGEMSKTECCGHLFVYFDPFPYLTWLK